MEVNNFEYNQINRPNILLAISDDQGWPYTSAYGAKFVKTPTFDRIAREGILFNNAFCPAPQCAPSRAALLLGRNIWENEEAGVHNGDFPANYQTYTDILAGHGYHVGYTGKGWGPGNFKINSRLNNPAGKPYNSYELNPPTKGISQNDYTENFKAFLGDRQEGQPFCFWFGCREPHRPYDQGTGIISGKNIDDIEVPGFLPDVYEIKSDLADYAYEIEWFDKHLGNMLIMLEELGELDNTIIIVTGDNGMPFPRAKANLYDSGIHVPLAIKWGARCKGGRVVNDFVSFIDFAPTFLEAASLDMPNKISGRSLMKILTSEYDHHVDPERNYVVTGMERHAVARIGDLGYPMRALRTKDYLYIRNYEIDRYPAGNPPLYGDVDGSPTKEFMIKNKETFTNYFNLAFGKRCEEELYMIEDDRACTENLAYLEKYEQIKSELSTKLNEVLLKQKDPRILGKGDVFDIYPHYGNMDKLKDMI